MQETPLVRAPVITRYTGLNLATPELLLPAGGRLSAARQVTASCLPGLLRDKDCCCRQAALGCLLLPALKAHPLLLLLLLLALKLRAGSALQQSRGENVVIDAQTTFKSDMRVQGGPVIHTMCVAAAVAAVVLLPVPGVRPVLCCSTAFCLDDVYIKIQGERCRQRRTDGLCLAKQIGEVGNPCSADLVVVVLVN